MTINTKEAKGPQGSHQKFSLNKSNLFLSIFGLGVKPGPSWCELYAILLC